MLTAKYKIGDTVKIKNINFHFIYAPASNRLRKRFIGKVFTIKSINSYKGKPTYQFENISFNWTEQMLEIPDSIEYIIDNLEL